MLGGADNPNGELLSYIIGADNMMNSLPVTSTGGYDKADSAGCDVRSDRKTLWR